MVFKKAVVTGGAGFIGSHIVDALITRGIETHSIDNLSLGKKEFVNPKAKLHIADVRHLSEIEPIIRGADVVFHLAAYPSVQYSIDHPEETGEINSGGTRNVLIAAQRGGVKRVIFSSSSSVYGDQDTFPFHEAMSPAPKSPYALEKLTGELYCKAWSLIYGLETVSLRYFNVYGERQIPEGPYAVVGRFLQLKRAGKKLPIFGDGEQTRDFVYVKDVVRANMLAAEHQSVGHGEVINIGTGESISINRIAKIIGGSVEYLLARIEPRKTQADITLAKKMLGWAPEILFETGIKNIL